MLLLVAPPPVLQRAPLLVSGHPFAFIQEEFVKRAEASEGHYVDGRHVSGVRPLRDGLSY